MTKRAVWIATGSVVLVVEKVGFVGVHFSECDEIGGIEFACVALYIDHQG